MIDTQYDVIVAGLGCAGFSAAVASARAGLRTLALEQDSMPGGILTVGGNNDIAQFWAHGKQIISGIGWEFVRRLEAEGGAEIPDMLRHGMPHDYYGVHVNIPQAAALMDEMLLESGVAVAYGQPLCEVRHGKQDGVETVTGVRYLTKTGMRDAGASLFIDCTGDGMLAYLAGADFELGEKTEKGTVLQPGTVRYFLPQRRLSQPEEERLTEVLRQETENGRLKAADTLGYPFSVLNRYHGNNLNHISGFNCADSDEKTLADMEGRRCVARIIRALRTAGIDPGVEMISSETAPRETRRILCDGYITAGDYIAARRYPDSVCNSFYPIDLHRDGMNGIHQIFLEEGQVPQIPLSAMTVRGFRNLMVAGRCASGDRLANSAYRVKASCMAMGQACGAAAAIMIRHGLDDIRRCPIGEIRHLLVDSGAIVPDETENHTERCENKKQKGEQT